ncbi:hypothetical protein PtB15_5B513 [Puccinia triticina]|nr:hypothetical protein PtB15_5B513 [Puccinia triticina]
MNQVADGLKVLADQYRLIVVVVNQVSDVMAPPSSSSELALPRPHNTIRAWSAAQSSDRGWNEPFRGWG